MRVLAERFSYKKFCMFMFLNLIVVLILRPLLFADGRNSPNSQIHTSSRGDYVFEREPVTWDNIMDGVWGDVIPGLKDPEISPVFGDQGLVPWEEYIAIDYTDPWQFKCLISLEPAIDNEFGGDYPDEGADTGIVVGLKYLFKRFKFEHFRRSILSFIINSNKTASGTSAEVAFYVDVP